MTLNEQTKRVKGILYQDLKLDHPIRELSFRRMTIDGQVERPLVVLSAGKHNTVQRFILVDKKTWRLLREKRDRKMPGQVEGNALIPGQNGKPDREFFGIDTEEVQGSPTHLIEAVPGLYGFWLYVLPFGTYPRLSSVIGATAEVGIASLYFFSGSPLAPLAWIGTNLFSKLIFGVVTFNSAGMSIKVTAKNDFSAFLQSNVTSWTNLAVFAPLGVWPFVLAAILHGLAYFVIAQLAAQRALQFHDFLVSLAQTDDRMLTLTVRADSQAQDLTVLRNIKLMIDSDPSLIAVKK